MRFEKIHQVVVDVSNHLRNACAAAILAGMLKVGRPVSLHLERTSRF